MKKNATLIVILAIALIFISASIAALFRVVQLVRREVSPTSRASIIQAKAQIPAKRSENSLAVFNFRYAGEIDTKYYAIGFSRALADRLYCAPTCITQQHSNVTIFDALMRLKQDPRLLVYDETALKTKDILAVRYILTGDFSLVGDNVTITAHLFDTKSKETKSAFTVKGSIDDLPNMQVELAEKIVNGMRVKLTQVQKNELQKPNFTKSEALLTYGHGFCDLKQKEKLRWAGVSQDPDSSFAVIRLLEHYSNKESTAPEIAGDVKLQKFINDVDRRFANNSHVHTLIGMLLIKQHKYEAAEKVLADVTKNDPGMALAYSSLRCVACCRQNGELAIKAAKRAVEIWPNNAHYHAMLAEAYTVAAENARHGHYFNQMSRSVEAKWRVSCQNSLNEALIAVKLDPDCSDGWCSVGSMSQQLGVDDYTTRSFEERIRIDPKDLDACIDYAYNYSPQWGGSPSDQQRIILRAEKVFGKDSTEMCLLRAHIMLCNDDYGRDSASKQRELSQLTQKAIDSCKATAQSEPVMLLRCRTLTADTQLAEFAKVAEEGFRKWGSPAWRNYYGMACERQYEYQHDRKYLNTAEELYRVYAREIPFDTCGHIQWGWCLSHQGHRQEAKREFLEALRLDPANELAKEKLTYVQ